MVASIEILWIPMVSRCIPYCGMGIFPCFFFGGGGSAPGHEQRMSTFCRVASFPHLGWRAIFIHGNDRFSVLKSDFEVYKHHMTCVFLFVKSHFPQNLTSRFGRKAWNIWLALLHLPEAATVHLKSSCANWHSSPVAADFGERVLRCSDGVIRVKTRVAMYGILLHPD